MVIVMNIDATDKQISDITNLLTSLGLGYHISKGEEKIVIGVIGDKKKLEGKAVEMMEGVEKVIPIVEPYKLASKIFKPEPTVVKVEDIEIGGSNIVIMAGPCAVESREQLFESAMAVKKAGAQFLRGGAFKPRTSPYSFQGLEEEGLKMLKEAKELTGLKIVTEVMDVHSVELVAEYADVIQIGTRNMQNFPLLKAVGRINKPVLLKRGLAATLEEWLSAAEYILSEGNKDVILCERGIRTFETYTRNTLDLSAVPAIKKLSHLPIVVDPSHGTGKWHLVAPMAKAAIAAGADGLIIEVHPDPKNALSDGAQSLTPENFETLCEDIKVIAKAVGRDFV
ncbi:3-deoxy-D-arabinoheptulosonate-7-phosphate synthase [Thermoanaerobacter thermohydrosulfuricus]|uniref:3-deoxy-D-arabino-heptulosonate 7-phosphate (DAHP) synthase n=3 Tax=Thermoanaerobacter TaxID=1754 RepID=I8R6Z4_9THEO|nr:MULTISPECIES: 3-deoxy-7-phosphoheptulonate synthase [Thermoanaerobacter]EGD52494.1 phospho-2-dehydro-3-deoxyheptonate aldolase [Thermoanaerobacter ethanolicus JW 200]EIW01385.1 3-deoxy-D-arabino-heptulosonate 7-phosphate (DAHP) synthase [Thermoanaerobacter siderophilus SR4]EMT38157.1 phospho-2-dehydro-3-deoxyheptonate aldolase [Thermoanaerobacter thermohydrosulfuricus WC1]UZQ83989.1 3-deoxy-7-phosphoheptulonate synthase [Thermoanaerobacter sp. RKWS2]SDG22631.1 3-deoxy-D-arabinoheptulosonate